MSGIALAIAISPTVTPHAAAAAGPPNDRDIALWLIADTDVYQDAGFTTPAELENDPVGGWIDQSPYAWEFINAHPHAYRITSASIPWIMFTNDPDPAYLEGNAVSIGAAYSFAMLIRLPTLTPADDIRILTEAGSGDKQIEMRLTPEIEWSNDIPYIPSSFTLLSGELTTDFVIVTGKTGADMYINGELAATVNEVANNPWAGIVIGDQAAGTATEIGIAELIIWEGELSNEDLAAAYSYLATKYGL
ncbi:MAG: hypothetical protein IPL78_21305 [Chloroflexi bacterium]|nr:hypothetical protein [Chloroflexota bacterium]